MPYADAATTYQARGWAPIRLAPGTKAPPPAGWTGYGAPYPSAVDVHEWATNGQGTGNVALRMPETVLGLDVDAYGGKPGAATLAEAEARLGPLPPTPISTSRDDGTSGIRFFRVPTGRCWADVVGPGVEVIHHGHRYAVAAPSVHPEGRLYRWLDADGRQVPGPAVDELPALPRAWVDELDRGSVADRAAKAEVTGPEQVAFLAAMPAGEPCPCVAKVLAEGVAELGRAASRHDAANRYVGRLVRAGEQGHRGTATALHRLEDAFRAAVDADPQRPVDRAEWARSVAGAVALVAGSPTPTADRGCRCRPEKLSNALDSSASGAGLIAAGRGDQLAALLDHVRGWHEVDDTDHVVFAVAVAVAAVDTAEPLWGMVVGAPSSGKTETVRLFDDVADARVDELTAAALLSWSRAKTPKPVGVLARVGAEAFVSVADFSTVLASSDRGARDQLFALLRRAYDGSVTRDLGNAPAPLSWRGRLTLLAAVTPAIDHYATHNDALRPRWLYWRMPPAGTERRRRGAGRMVAGQLATMRQRGRELATEAVRLGREALSAVELDEQARMALADAAVAVCAARGAVPRDGYGKREVIGVPVVEEPYRLVDQLRTLTRACIALGLDPAAAVRLARRAALATVPEARRKVLQALAAGEPLGVAQTARRAGVHHHVARVALEDLRELRLTCCPVEDRTDDPAALGNAPRDWQLTVEDGDLAAAVIRAAAAWHEKGEPTPQPPQDQEEETDTSRGVPHTSCQPSPQVSAAGSEPAPPSSWDALWQCQHGVERAGCIECRGVDP